MFERYFERYLMNFATRLQVVRCFKDLLGSCRPLSGLVLTLKLVLIWVPALAAWTAVAGDLPTYRVRGCPLTAHYGSTKVSGVTLDLRTPEEINQEEQEALHISGLEFRLWLNDISDVRILNMACML